LKSIRAIAGTLLSAQIADWVGRKATIMICLGFSFVAITLEIVAVNIETFFGGKLVNGFATGALATVCTTYIGEIAPLALRGLLTVSGPLTFCETPSASSNVRISV
jgi:SP family general alpha glucoside:H+ symporter-like MFS transporter